MHLVSFDVDGTLVASDDFDAELYLRSIRAVIGIDIGSDWSRYEHVTDSGILEQILREQGLAADARRLHVAVRQDFTRRVADYIDARAGRLNEIPGARELIERLQRHPEVRVALATGGWHETACLKLGAIGLDGRRLSLASASDAHARIDIMRLAEQRALGTLQAAARTYFGDGPWDKRASESLQYRFIAVGRVLDHAPRFADLSDHRSVFAELGLAA